jgi:hypothetical protein
MSDKSYVTLEQKVCLVCTKMFETGDLLLDRRLRPQFEMHTVTGWALCTDCDKLFKDGYVALVGVDPTKSAGAMTGASMDPREAYRTGDVIHVRRTVFHQIFSFNLVEGQPMIFAPPDVIAHLKAIPVADQPAP